MKISVCSGNFGKISLKEAINRAAELRFDAIEITVMFHAHPSISSSERKKVYRWLDDAGIVCSAIHFIFDGNVKLASTYKEDIQHSILHNRAVIDLAADLNTKIIVVGGGGTRSVKPGQSREEIMKILVEIFAASGDYAKERGIYLGMEALNRYETNVIKTLKDSSEFAVKTKCPNVKIMGDTYHMNIEETNLDDAIRDAGKELIHLHLADSNRMVPGEGHIDFKKVFMALKDIKYEGFCSFEVFAITPELLYFKNFEEASKHMEYGKKYVDELLKHI